MRPQVYILMSERRVLFLHDGFSCHSLVFGESGVEMRGRVEGKGLFAVHSHS